MINGDRHPKFNGTRDNLAVVAGLGYDTWLLPAGPARVRVAAG
jgi:hypothetical protein